MWLLGQMQLGHMRSSKTTNGVRTERNFLSFSLLVRMYVFWNHKRKEIKSLCIVASTIYVPFIETPIEDENEPLKMTNSLVVATSSLKIRTKVNSTPLHANFTAKMYSKKDLRGLLRDVMLHFVSTFLSYPVFKFSKTLLDKKCLISWNLLFHFCICRVFTSMLWLHLYFAKSKNDQCVPASRWFLKNI